MSGGITFSCLYFFKNVEKKIHSNGSGTYKSGVNFETEPKNSTCVVNGCSFGLLFALNSPDFGGYSFSSRPPSAAGGAHFFGPCSFRGVARLFGGHIFRFVFFFLILNTFELFTIFKEQCRKCVFGPKNGCQKGPKWPKATGPNGPQSQPGRTLLRCKEVPGIPSPLVPKRRLCPESGCISNADLKKG